MYTSHLNQIARTYRQLRYSGESGNDQLRRAAEIGHAIYNEGGEKAMHEMSLEVTESTENFLNYAWDGIGNWST